MAPVAQKTKQYEHEFVAAIDGRQYTFKFTSDKGYSEMTGREIKNAMMTARMFGPDGAALSSAERSVVKRGIMKDSYEVKRVRKESGDYDVVVREPVKNIFEVESITEKKRAVPVKQEQPQLRVPEWAKDTGAPKKKKEPKEKMG